MFSPKNGEVAASLKIASPPSTRQKRASGPAPGRSPPQAKRSKDSSAHQDQKKAVEDLEEQKLHDQLHDPSSSRSYQFATGKFGRDLQDEQDHQEEAGPPGGGAEVLLCDPSVRQNHVVPASRTSTSSSEFFRGQHQHHQEKQQHFAYGDYSGRILQSSTSTTSALSPASKLSRVEIKSNYKYQPGNMPDVAYVSSEGILSERGVPLSPKAERQPHDPPRPLFYSEEPMEVDSGAAPVNTLADEQKQFVGHQAQGQDQHDAQVGHQNQSRSSSMIVKTPPNAIGRSSRNMRRSSTTSYNLEEEDVDEWSTGYNPYDNSQRVYRYPPKKAKAPQGLGGSERLEGMLEESALEHTFDPRAATTHLVPRSELIEIEKPSAALAPTATHSAPHKTLEVDPMLNATNMPHRYTANYSAETGPFEDQDLPEPGFEQQDIAMTVDDAAGAPQREAAAARSTPAGPSSPSSYNNRQAAHQQEQVYGGGVTKSTTSEYTLMESGLIAPTREEPKILCPHCGRKFAEAASIRHIAVCARLKSKPKGACRNQKQRMRTDHLGRRVPVEDVSPSNKDMIFLGREGIEAVENTTVPSSEPRTSRQELQAQWEQVRLLLSSGVQGVASEQAIATTMRTTDEGLSWLREAIETAAKLQVRKGHFCRSLLSSSPPPAEWKLKSDVRERLQLQGISVRKLLKIKVSDDADVDLLLDSLRLVKAFFQNLDYVCREEQAQQFQGTNQERADYIRQHFLG
ncbi:unnamed protein product [Amoebophrya sp. A25]|nr:unnamed protein product [Amoebophrya sp. A25]|eukprot:GSA25T00009282001.1